MQRPECGAVCQTVQASAPVVAVVAVQAVSADHFRESPDLIAAVQSRPVIPISQADELSLLVIGVGHSQVAGQRQLGTQAACIALM